MHCRPRFTVRLLQAALLSAVALSAGAALAATDAKTIHMIPQGDLKILDPIQNPSYITRNHGYMIYDTLFAQNSKGEVKPQMVDSYKVSADKKVWTFTLRAGLKWSDGTPVTSTDCVASIKRWASRDVSGKLLGAAIGSIEAVDVNVFTITLAKPFGPVIEMLGKPSSNVPFMMPERVAKTEAAEQIKDSTGSGPFIFKKDEWVPGSKVVYVKNPHYVPRKEPADGLAGGKVVKVERVEWNVIPDQNTALSAFKSGEMDVYELPPADFLEPLAKESYVKLSVDSLGNQGWLRPNHLLPPFNNAKARQALIYMVNQEEYLAASGFAAKYRHPTCMAYFMCGSVNDSKAGAQPYQGGQNLEKARQLLKESGYKGEKVVVLTPSEPPIQAAAALVTVQNLKKIGVNVEAQAMDWGTLQARRAKKDGWNIFHTYSVGADVYSPAVNSYAQASCDASPSGWPCDAELEKLRAAWVSESDQGKRKKLTDAIQARMYEVVPYVNFGQFFQPMVYRSNLSGVLNVGIPVMWNVEKK
jgi:peptide/nickel transport system substrate-binding protein